MLSFCLVETVTVINKMLFRLSFLCFLFCFYILAILSLGLLCFTPPPPPVVYLPFVCRGGGFRWLLVTDSCEMNNI